MPCRLDADKDDTQALYILDITEDVIKMFNDAPQAEVVNTVIDNNIPEHIYPLSTQLIVQE